jgi:hypothetical protein
MSERAPDITVEVDGRRRAACELESIQLVTTVSS